jgi:hypothetical protein
MYDGPVVIENGLTEVAIDGDAAFYPAHTPMRDRRQAGLRFELAPGRPWRWTGPGGQADVTLADIMAAVNHARIVELPGWPDIDLAAIHAAHDRATRAALGDRDVELAARLVREQAEVSAAALIGEEDAARRLGIVAHTLDGFRYQYRSICPPVLIAGQRRTKWFWGPAQFSAWEQARPGKGWRKGRRAARPDGHPGGAGQPRAGRGRQRALRPQASSTGRGRRGSSPVILYRGNPVPGPRSRTARAASYCGYRVRPRGSLPGLEAPGRAARRRLRK